MLFTLSMATLASAATPLPTERANACRTVLTGEWAGKGLVEGFGKPVQVDHAASFRRDGSFVTRNRYLGDDKKWVEQELTGTWSATPGRKRNQCKLAMKMQGSGFESSSSSDIVIVNANTYRSLGFDMHRAGTRPTKPR